MPLENEEHQAMGGVVVGELAEAGYDCFWQIIGADDVGAPHRRKRWLCFGVLADPDSQRGRGRTADRQYATDVGQPPQLEERHRGIPTWPPGPKQTDEWARILAERPDLSPLLPKTLSPIFVEWLMGVPINWTSLKPLKRSRTTNGGTISQATHEIKQWG